MTETPAGGTERIERRSSGSIAGLRRPLPWPADRPFRILSIDGGGIRGIFPAAVLAEVERDLGGASAGDYFDLIAGTSTGGIIALGLGLGMPASRILDLYLRGGSAIFPPIAGPLAGLRRRLRRIGQIGRYAYEREPLKKALREVFEDRLFGEAQRRLCVPAFDGNYNEVHKETKRLPLLRVVSEAVSDQQRVTLDAQRHAMAGQDQRLFRAFARPAKNSPLARPS
jgi:predicted acylesterase/phospholipase RssA